MESSRLTRALKLLNLLQSGHGATVDYLANALECSKRTVFRDIKLLNANNIRIWFDERLGGYTAERQLWALASSLDDRELVSVLVSATLSPVARIGPFMGTVDQAVAKMMGRASQDIRDRVNRLVRAIVPSCEQVNISRHETDVFCEMVDAIAHRHQVRIQWIGGAGDAAASTKLSPYQLSVAGKQWTVVGRSTLHRKVVRVALESIRDVEKTDDIYNVPVEYLQAGSTGTPPSRQALASVGTIPPPPKGAATKSRSRREASKN